MQGEVLVLNANFEPIHVCNIRRAIGLVYTMKASMVLNGGGTIRTQTNGFPRPSVIRLQRMVNRPRPIVRLTRREVFRRDNYTCQYCGTQSRSLTLDHVVPRYRGGQHTWENVVSACAACNRRKAGRTPKEANMKLGQEPAPPRNGPLYVVPYRYLENRDEWHKYMMQ